MSLSSTEPQHLYGSFCNHLPDSLLLYIFGFLSPKEIMLASEVCRNWHRLSLDELLWKRILQRTLFSGARDHVEVPRCSSWFEEFRWIHQNTPLIESQVLPGHSDEVLHVAFSHDGKLLSTSSKDCTVILWRVNNCYRVSAKEKLNFEGYNWEYVQFSEFNANDSLLLVSGVNKMRDFNFRGEIIICELVEYSEPSLRVIHNINSEPYDVFGAWLNERCYISGTFEFVSPNVNNHSSISELWVNSVDDMQNRNQTKLARVINCNASSVRTVLIARPKSREVDSSEMLQGDDRFCLIFTHGTVTFVPHQIVFKWLKLNHRTKRKPDLATSSGINISYMENGNSSEDSLCIIEERCIETNAHIIGMSLSPDHEYLYVNCRQWECQDGKQSPGSSLDNPPEISSDISLQVYSLATYELVGVHVGHRAFTANDSCFFIFLNVADRLVASGAEDCCAHVWDRYSGVKLATPKGHSNVVNCVAFNPVNQQMLVSASDDHTVRVWNSRQLSNWMTRMPRQQDDQTESDDLYKEVKCSSGEEGSWRETSV